MNLSNNKWIIAENIPFEIDRSLSDFPLGLRRLLYNRGIYTKQEAEGFLQDAGSLHDSFLLQGMDEAVERIAFAVENNQPVVVYGDYDVDGTSATALLVSFLKAYGAQVSAYIPDRFEEGYGINDDALAELARLGTRLVITVDCGIRSVKEVELAAKNGLDMIITDHHQTGPKLPPALSIINPKKPGEMYPDRNLAGVGLAYKLAQAFYQSHPGVDIDIESYLDLVALGTVADIVPLTGENRALVKAGLVQLRTAKHIGLSALSGAAGINIRHLKASDIGFRLGPRLNAAGRLTTARTAYDLLTAQDRQQAHLLAQKLDDLNRDRQNLVLKLVELADEQKEAEQLENITISFHPDFHQGVVGLVASRMVDKHYRPAIIGQIKQDHVVASCRSIPGFHITQALDECADLLTKYGGHEMAAGFSLPLNNREEFTQRLIDIIERELADRDLRPELKADMELGLSQIQDDILEKLEKIEPTGQENPEVFFVSRNVEVLHKRTVGDGQHLSMKVRDGRKIYNAIAFRKGEYFSAIPERIDMLYNLMRNEYNGVVSTQLNVKDIKIPG